MRHPALVLFILLCLATGRVSAASLQEEVRTADTARIMATIAGDTTRLAPLLSDALIYGHADGRVQNKEDFLGAVKSSRMKYEAYDYEELQIDRVSDDVATMSGRARLRAVAGGKTVAFRLRFLAVWRHESGKWQLQAYQSAPLPEPVKP